MAYVKIIYQNSPSTATPINAENLNHMDDQIALNDQRLTEIETSYVKSFNGRKGEVTPQAGDYDISQIAPTEGATVGQIPIVRNDGTEEEPNLTFHMEDVPSSGHVIKDQSGTALAQEDALQFADAFLTDDSVNGRTVVENIKEVSPADYDSTTDEGIIVTDDGDDALIGPVSDEYVEVTADGNTTYGTLIGTIYTNADITKIDENSYIMIDSELLRIDRKDTTEFCFTTAYIDSAEGFIRQVILRSSGAYTQRKLDNTFTSKTNNNAPEGTKITLYYGNKKATVDLQTTANRCWYDDNTTVKQKIDSINNTLAQELYEEHTTRETSLTSTMVHHQNTGFLSNGYYSISKRKKQVTIHIGGISSKSNIDWITVMNSGYRPSRTEYFPYYLGNTLCRGYIQSDGIIYFETLNTSDVLSATVTYNIA